MSGPSSFLLRHSAPRRLAPELLEPVELARLPQALDPAREEAMVLLEALVDPVVDRLGLPVGVSRADDEEIGVAEHAAEVELGDVDGLLVGRVLRDLAGEAGGVGGVVRGGAARGFAHVLPPKDRRASGEPGCGAVYKRSRAM